MILEQKGEVQDLTGQDLYSRLLNTFQAADDKSLLILVESMKSEIEKLTQKSIDQMDNQYVCFYSLTKNWIKNRNQLKLKSKIKNLYRILHCILQHSFEINPKGIRAILKEDENFQITLSNDLENFKNDKDLHFYIFDILTQLLKCQLNADTSNQEVEKTLNIFFNHGIGKEYSDQLKYTAQRFIGKLVEQNIGSCSEKLKDLSLQYLETVFLNNHSLEDFINLMFKTVQYINQKNKELILTQIYEIVLQKNIKEHISKIFLLIEKIFAQQTFGQSFLIESMKFHQNFYETNLSQFGNKKILVSFSQSYLQVQLNYYHNFPTFAKASVPTIFSFLLEFLSESYDDILQKQQLKIILKCLELLIDNTFDLNLFQELQSKDQQQINQLSELIQSLNLEHQDAIHQFSSKTTVSKIFTLLIHSVSSRFYKNISLVLKMLDKIFEKFKLLSLKQSQPFNEFSIAFYQHLTKADITDKSILIVLFKQIFESINIQYFLNFIYNIPQQYEEIIKYNQTLYTQLSTISFEQNTQQLQNLQLQLVSNYSNFFQNLVDDEQFTFFLYVLEKSKIQLSYKGLYSSLFPLLIIIMENLGREVNDQNMRILRSLSKFIEIEIDDPNLLLGFFSFLVQQITRDDEKPYQKILNNMFISFLCQYANSQKQLTRSLNTICDYLQHNLILSKICKKLVLSDDKIKRKSFQNMISLLVCLLDDQYVQELVIKNLEKINNLIESEKYTEQTMRECEIVCSIIYTLKNIHQKSTIFEGVLRLGRNMLNIRKKETTKLSLRILENLLKNCHPDFYPKIESIINNEISINLQKNNKISYENNSSYMKFLEAYLKSLELNSSQLQLSLLEFADHYFNLIIFNLKNRNSKARKQSKYMIQQIFMIFQQDKPLQENNDLLARIIAGLGAEGKYTISCSVIAIQILFKKFCKKMTEELKTSFIELMIYLLQQKQREVYLSVCKFFKTWFKYENKKTLSKSINFVMNQLHDSDTENFTNNRNQIKTLCQILLDKYDQKFLGQFIPESWHKLYKNVKKVIKTKVNKINREKNQASLQKQEKKIQSDDEDDIEMNQEYEQKKKVIEKVSKDPNQEDVFFNPETGKLIIKQQKIQQKAGYKRDYETFENQHAEDVAKKLKIQEKIDQSQVGVSLGARTLKRLKESRQKRDQVHFVQESGSTYQNKLTKTDMMLKNKPNPHAFVQFNPVALSKKLRNQASKTFEVLMKKKKKGALKGLKVINQLR